MIAAEARTGKLLTARSGNGTRDRPDVQGAIWKLTQASPCHAYRWAGRKAGGETDVGTAGGPAGHSP